MMNKEEIIQYMNNIDFENTDKVYEIIYNLQQRIDKAIEYIKRFDIERLHECMEHNLVEVLEDLDEILGGKE